MELLGIKLTRFISNPILVRWKDNITHEQVMNTNGATKDRITRGRRILRNKIGEQKTNLLKFFNKGTNNMVETNALLGGIQICMELNILDV